MTFPQPPCPIIKDDKKIIKELKEQIELMECCYNCGADESYCTTACIEYSDKIEHGKIYKNWIPKK